jgi:hypothetical protein
MTKRRSGRRAKVESPWNRRLKVERVERAAEQAESNDYSTTRPRMRAKGLVDRYAASADRWTPEQPDTPPSDTEAN